MTAPESLTGLASLYLITLFLSCWDPTVLEKLPLLTWSVRPFIANFNTNLTTSIYPGGHIKPESGDVKINETSVYQDLTKARVSFGVCPQFTAVDAHLTVREHLYIYGRFRGLGGEELQNNIDSLLAATGLDSYANRLATKLSGGNQRKLALTIALIGAFTVHLLDSTNHWASFLGNPPVVLVDEYSTGIDARMKRELWAVLKQVTNDKAVFLTTRKWISDIQLSYF
jgi:ABC-type multidrug transport system ATPase subunit